MRKKLAVWAREKGNTYKTAVAESSAETLNACGEMVRPVNLQAYLNEAGRQALLKIGHKRPYIS